MSIRRRGLLAAAVLTAGLALAPPLQAQQAERYEPNRVTRTELERVRSRNALDAVQALRPQWLQTRGQVSMERQAGVRVYVDGVPRRSLDELRAVSVDQISSIEYFSASQATQRWGTGHAAGAILVRTL